MKQNYFLKISCIFFLLFFSSNLNAQINGTNPTFIRNYFPTQGSWVSDPLETNGAGLIWVIPSNQDDNVYEYASIGDLTSNNIRTTYNLPTRFLGTGHVVYGGNLYYNKAGSFNIVKYNLATRTIVMEAPIINAGNYPYQWGGGSFFDFAVDENGLWVLYSTAANSGKLVVSKLDPSTLLPTSTWNTNSEPKNQMGDAFIIDGVVYCIDSFNNPSQTINYTYDTNTSTGAPAAIPWVLGASSYMTSAQYNHKEGLIYVWNNARLFTYDASGPCADDTDPPFAVAQDITVELDNNGEVIINPNEVDFGSNDTCSDVVLSLDKDTFDCSNVGPNEVILTVTDASNNKSTATATVTIKDASAPTAEFIVPSNPNVFTLLGRTTTLNNINLAGSGSNVATVTPGSSVNISFNRSTVNNGDSCPGCITQHYIGIAGGILPAQCLFSDNGNTSANHSFSFTAPTLLGYIILREPDLGNSAV
ncbi:olfactomedin domain-containing protein [Gillisia marina]|uniref:olfactomedin domain-containing protein n=1 Tax=Gillisia marina TaxID=1167637 RepID=UPI00029AB4CB|nr:olfactomedin domain-containing protein [Gillisia marina]